MKEAGVDSEAGALGGDAVPLSQDSTMFTDDELPSVKCL
jgi:hypothetical protein